MVRESELREGELTVDMPPAARRRAGVHRPHPHALEIAAGDAAAGPSRRPGLPAGDLRALGARDQGRRFLRKSRSDLLAAPVAPRPGAAKPEEQPENPRHLFAALAGAAQPDRHLDREVRRRSRATSSWCAASIASTRRRCSTSSPTAANSRRWRRRSRGISRRSDFARRTGGDDVIRRRSPQFSEVSGCQSVARK